MKLLIFLLLLSGCRSAQIPENTLKKIKSDPGLEACFSAKDNGYDIDGIYCVYYKESK